MLTLEQLVKMREFDRYFYKSMVIESYIDYDQDGEFREYSVQVAGKLHTFSSPKQVFEFVKSVEETIQDEDSQKNLFNIRREITFTPGKPKTVIVGYNDSLSEENIKQFRDGLLAGLPHDPKIHKVVLMAESSFNTVIETKKEVNIYINGERHAIND